MPDTTTTVIGNLTDNLEVHDTENGIARGQVPGRGARSQLDRCGGAGRG
jgi:hypothetical protein